MKIFHTSIMLALIVLTFGLTINAEEITTEQMQIKCFVGFEDGSQGIRYWRLSKMSLKSVETMVLGVVNVNDKGVKQKITRVLQCIQRNKSFMDIKANNLEKSKIG